MSDLLTDPFALAELREGEPPRSRPMIIADDAYVTYRVHAAGRRVGRESLLSVSAVRGGRELREVPALRGVTFTASEGETIGVVGHNGSGKSTLFRAMSGLIPTSQGQILARERPVLLGVNAALVPELSGENNIKLGLLALGFTAEEAAARVDEIADFAELNEFIHHPMRTYSSGMSARLKFAIASAKAHSILLIDEALAVGDRRFKAKSESRIRELRETAGLVMIVSHSIGSLKDTCSRVLWIHKGELRADGAAPEVIRDYVAWTKNPANIAVGAASTQKTKAAVNPSPVTPAEKQELAPVVAVPGESALERLLSDAAAAAAEDEAAVAEERAARVAAKTGAIPVDSARTLARRERYRRAMRERNRRRLIVIVLTGAAILVAVAAGAAVAALANVSQSDGSSGSAAVPGGAPASISSFDAPSPVAQCTTAEGVVDVSLTWDVKDAAWIALASDVEEVDAVESPIASGLPDTSDGNAVPFPCSADSRVYTLTAVGEGGRRVSETITVTRAPLPTPTPTPSDADTGQSGTTNPGQSTNPGTSQPGTTDPGVSNPGTTDPGVSEPVPTTPTEPETPVEPTTPTEPEVPVEPTTPPEGSTESDPPVTTP